MKYLWLLLLTVASAVVSWWFHGCYWAIDAFGPNLAAGFLGSLITTWLIERGLRKRELRMQQIAMGEIAIQLNLFVTEFLLALRSAQIAPPEPRPTSVLDVLTPKSMDALDWLDLSTPTPGYVGPWRLRLPGAVAHLRDGFASVIARYGAYFAADSIEAVEALRNDPFFSILGGNNDVLNGTAEVRITFAKRFERLVGVLQENGYDVPLPPTYLDETIEPAFGAMRLKELPPPVEHRVVGIASKRPR